MRKMQRKETSAYRTHAERIMIDRTEREQASHEHNACRHSCCNVHEAAEATAVAAELNGRSSRALLNDVLQRVAGGKLNFDPFL